jgi:hypothetical protein
MQILNPIENLHKCSQHLPMATIFREIAAILAGWASR